MPSAASRPVPTKRQARRRIAAPIGPCRRKPIRPCERRRGETSHLPFPSQANARRKQPPAAPTFIPSMKLLTPMSASITAQPVTQPYSNSHLVTATYAILYNPRPQSGVALLQNHSILLHIYHFMSRLSRQAPSQRFRSDGAIDTGQPFDPLHRATRPSWHQRRISTNDAARPSRAPRS